MQKTARIYVVESCDHINRKDKRSAVKIKDSRGQINFYGLVSDFEQVIIFQMIHAKTSEMLKLDPRWKSVSC